MKKKRSSEMMKRRPRKTQMTLTKTLRRMIKLGMVAKVRIMYLKRRKKVRKVVTQV